MKAFKLMVLSMLLSCPVYSKTDRAKIRKYYNAINAAELNIVKNNYDDAAEYYKKAFTFKYPNGKDLYNAFLIAYYETNTSLAIKYINELAGKGLKRNYFIDTVKEAGFYQIVFSKFDSCYNAGMHNNLAQAWKQLSDSLWYDDQRLRITDPPDWDGMPFLDSINIARTKKYIVVNGFPSFEKVGFWDDSSPVEPGIIWMELWHNRLYATSDIDSLVEEAVLDGNFRPDDWAAILMTRENPDSCIFCMKIWRIPERFTKEQEDKIDKNRDALYLPDMAQYRMMWDFDQENKEQGKTSQDYVKFSQHENLRGQFVLLNIFLVLSKLQIKMGVD